MQDRLFQALHICQHEKIFMIESQSDLIKFWKLLHSRLIVDIKKQKKQTPKTNKQTKVHLASIKTKQMTIFIIKDIRFSLSVMRFYNTHFTPLVLDKVYNWYTYMILQTRQYFRSLALAWLKWRPRVLTALSGRFFFFF